MLCVSKSTDYEKGKIFSKARIIHTIEDVDEKIHNTSHLESLLCQVGIFSFCFCTCNGGYF